MIQQIAPAGVGDAKPAIHVWMTLREAAAALGVSDAVVTRGIEWGELESRVTAGGIREALIRLPRRPEAKAAPAGENQPLVRVPVQTAAPVVRQNSGAMDRPELADQWASVAATLLPAMRSLRTVSSKDFYKARRNARMAWTAAAVMLLAVCTSTLLALRAVTASRTQLQTATSQLVHIADDAATLSIERNRLRDQLADAEQAASRAQAELVVDRKVEDTLFKAAIAAKAAAEIQRSAVFADGSR